MYYDESLIDLIREALMITLKVAAPLLAAGIIIGLIVSILQSVTSIQDQALSFVPKIVTMVAVAIVLMPWIFRRLLDFTTDMLGTLLN